MPEGAGGDYALSDEVVASIAGIAATEVEGVASLAGGLVGGLSEMLGGKAGGHGVRVTLGTREVAIDVHLIVDYGVRIPALAEKVQQQVKQAVESMTSLRVVEVNVHVQGIRTPQVGDGPAGRVLG